MAQLGARFHGMEEVVGSIPTRSTNKPIKIRDLSLYTPDRIQLMAGASFAFLRTELRCFFARSFAAILLVFAAVLAFLCVHRFTLSLPLERILARNPPRPCNAFSAPGAIA